MIKLWKWLLMLAVMLLVLMVVPGVGVAQSPIAVATEPVDLEGWANVPGGTVWLRPGIDSYEHSTGLVRDMRTGKKYYAVTPQVAQAYTQAQPIVPLVANCGPCINAQTSGATVVTPQVAPQQVAPSRPYAPSFLPNPYYAPFTPPARSRVNSSRYDYGPYGATPYSYGFESKASQPRSLKSEFGTLNRF